MPKVSKAEIAKRAHEIWEREGRPQGRDLDHWLAAERDTLEAALARVAPHLEVGNSKSAGKKAAAKSAGKPRTRTT